MNKIAQKILKAKSILLSTHRTPDGDGLGSELALYHALTKIGKEVQLVHVDKPAFKYGFLIKKAPIEYFETSLKNVPDLALLFDTNDGRLLPGLWEELEKESVEFAFIDHHPILQEAPSVGELSYIDTEAASTGEITFDLIEKLDIEIDENIAEAIYTSICFDTQLFRYIKSSAKSHTIAAKLIPFIENPEDIHDSLFGNIPIEKFRFISFCTNKIEFHHNDCLAYLEVTDEDLVRFNMSNEDTRDLTDQILGIDSVELSLVVSPSSEGKKLSFRSKKPLEILQIAKSWDGGGHKYASGAFVPSSHENFKILKEKLIKQLGELL